MEIPSIQTNENGVVLPTKEIPLIVNGEKVMIKCKPLTAGKRRDIVKKYSSTRIVGSQIQGDADGLSVQIGLISATIVEAPFDTSEKGLSELPSEVLDYLYENCIEEKKKIVED